eukprot:5072496-Alexandrium_andersonii.AAC.1
MPSLGRSTEPPRRAGRPAGLRLRAPSRWLPSLPWHRAHGSRCTGPYTSGPRRLLPPGSKCQVTSRLPSSARVG